MRLLAISVLAVSASLLGCASQPTAGEASGRADLPPDWTVLATKDKRLAALSPSVRTQLDAVISEMAHERDACIACLNADGTWTYSPKLEAQIAKAQAACDRNYLASWTVVQRYISPEMDGLTQTWAGYEINDVNIDDLNRRGLRDDWARIWLMDTPSTLNAVPVGNFTGNP